MRLTIVNNGNQTVDRISVRSEDGSIKETLTGISIVPGASKDVIWNGITLPSELTDIFTVDLSILAEGEKESSENRIYLSVGEPDLSIEAYQNFSGGEQFASILVTNNGIIPSDAELTVYKDAEHKKKLYETKVPRLKQDESRITLLNLTELASKSQMFYFVVSDAGNKETYTEDNQAILYVGKGIYLDEEQDSDTDAGNTKPSVNQENKYDNPGNSVEEPLAPIEKKPSVSVVKSLKGKAGKKKLTLSWKKLSGVSGYQIQISTKKNFKGAKKISVSKSKKTYTKKKLKSNKKYYARIRAYKIYKNAKGKKVKAYGKWKTIKKKIK